MEQIKQLLDILSQTPEMALWGLTIYFLFILMKLASWIIVMKFIISKFIDKFFANRTEKIELEKEKLNISSASRILKYFNSRAISNVTESHLLDLLRAIHGNKHEYIHDSDIQDAINSINKDKRN